jgi:hypothetical protein
MKMRLSPKRNFRFEKVENGDLIKFKMLKSQNSQKHIKGNIYSNSEINYNDSINNDEHKFTNEKYVVYYGKVVDASKLNYLGLTIDISEKKGNIFLDCPLYVDRRSVLQIYSSKYIEHLTPRLALKYLWKDFVFREVKTTKCNNLLYVEYKYVSPTGFERIKKFSSLEEAYANVPLEYHRNIVTYYNDYFGFTTNKALRDNDSYYDKEIFFSKKCYCELDWSSSPTGDFLVNEKGYNLINPAAESLICGIVENGEKGLFFRKWFVCSKEFLTLWTMVCAPNDPSLFEQSHIVDEDVSKLIKKDRIWITKTTKDSKNAKDSKDGKDRPKKKIKDFDVLLEELDTSYYSINMNLSLEEKKKKYKTYNLERCALYFPNRYKQIAQVLFYRGFMNEKIGNSEDFFTEYTEFQKKLLRNILWSKSLV